MKKNAVVILCYHRFRFRKKRKRIKDAPYVVFPDVFEKQMAVLKEEGCSVISMKQYLSAREGRAMLPPRPVIITIDDGFRCTYTKAFPILKKYGYPAEVYIYEDFIDGKAAYLTPEQLRKMAKHGIEAGCHSKSHPRLTRIKGDKNRLRREIIDSKNNLEKITGMKIRTFSYPYGAYSGRLFLYLKKAGYKAAVTVEKGVNTLKTRPYRLKRYTIYAGTGMKRFRNIIKKSL